MDNKGIDKEYSSKELKVLEPKVLVKLGNVPEHLREEYINALKRGDQSIFKSLIDTYLDNLNREKKRKEPASKKSLTNVSDIKKQYPATLSVEDLKKSISEKDTRKIEKYKKPGRVIKERGIPWLRHLVEASPSSIPSKQLWVDPNILRACYYFEGLDCNYFITSYRLFNLTDYKLLAYICQQVDKKRSPIIETSLYEICNVMGYSISGKGYREITNILQNLFSTEIVSLSKWNTKTKERYTKEDFYKSFAEKGFPPEWSCIHILSFKFKESQGITIYLDNAFYQDLGKYCIYLDPVVFQFKSIQEFNLYAFLLGQYGYTRSIELETLVQYLGFRDTNIRRVKKKIVRYSEKFEKLGLRGLKKPDYFKRGHIIEMVKFIDK